MIDRLDKLEDQVRQDLKELREDVTDIKISVKAIEVKVNSSVNIFKEFAKWGVMISAAIISGLFGHKFI